ncbi:MAG: DUF5343 domain-containing protein [Anaerolineae bacterium]|nr:DUF5343 domain-containing protein [Anaerolineae bacterium]
MAESEKVIYPRIPESNWWTLRDQFKKTLPNSVNVNYLKSLLGLGSDQAARNVIAPLQKIGLIDDDGRPTSLANEWRHDATYPEVCQKILVEVYPQELRDLYSGSGLDRDAVERWFSLSAQLGQGAARQSAALYMLLHDGVPKSSTEFSKTRSNKGESKSRAKNAKSTSSSRNKSDGADSKSAQPARSIEVSTPQLEQQIGRNSDLTLHIDLQIHISPDATAEQIDQIFASIARHIVKKDYSS